MRLKKYRILLVSFLFLLLYLPCLFAKETKEISNNVLLEKIEMQNRYMEKRFEMIEKRFEMIDKRFEMIDKRFERVDKRFERVDKRFEELIANMNARFERVDKRFEELIANMNARFERVDKRFEEMNTRMDKRFKEMNTRMDKRFAEMMHYMDKRFERAETDLDFLKLLYVTLLTFTIGAPLIIDWRRRKREKENMEKLNIIIATLQELAKDDEKLRSIMKKMDPMCLIYSKELLDN
jgi:exonuclease VII large subunit